MAALTRKEHTMLLNILNWWQNLEAIHQLGVIWVVVVFVLYLWVLFQQRPPQIAFTLLNVAGWTGVGVLAWYGFDLYFNDPVRDTQGAFIIILALAIVLIFGQCGHDPDFFRIIINGKYRGVRDAGIFLPLPPYLAHYDLVKRDWEPMRGEDRNVYVKENDGGHTYAIVQFGAQIRPASDPDAAGKSIAISTPEMIEQARRRTITSLHDLLGDLTVTQLIQDRPAGDTEAKAIWEKVQDYLLELLGNFGYEAEGVFVNIALPTINRKADGRATADAIEQAVEAVKGDFPAAIVGASLILGDALPKMSDILGNAETTETAGPATNLFGVVSNLLRGGSTT